MCVTEMHVLVIKTEFSNIASDLDKNLFLCSCVIKKGSWSQTGGAALIHDTATDTT